MDTERNGHPDPGGVFRLNIGQELRKTRRLRVVATVSAALIAAVLAWAIYASSADLLGPRWLGLTVVGIVAFVFGWAAFSLWRVYHWTGQAQRILWDICELHRLTALASFPSEDDEPPADDEGRAWWEPGYSGPRG